MFRARDAGTPGTRRVSTHAIGIVLILLVTENLCLFPQCRSEVVGRLPDSVSAIPPQPSLDRELIQLVRIVYLPLNGQFPRRESGRLVAFDLAR